MQLGFVSAILPELNLEDLCHFAVNSGYDCIEIMCWPSAEDTRRYAGVGHIDVVGITDQKVSKIQKIVADHGLFISGLGYYPNPLDPDPTHANKVILHLKRVIRAASRLNITRVNTFVGRDPGKTIAQNWSDFIKIWEPLIILAESENVKIGIENCPMLFTDDEWPGGKNLAISPQIWRKMFAEIPSDYFGLNYDPSHLVLQQMDYLKPLGEFADKLFHIHAKDLRIDRDRLDDVGIFASPSQWHTPKIPGMGDIDWGRFMSYLYDTGYSGPVCVEVEDRAFEKNLESRKKSLEISARYLRQFM